jgi:soluble lytic murein transglycosylase-like protein
MKFLKWSFILIVMACLWTLAGSLTSVHLATLESSGVLPYGPLPDQEINSYQYQAMNSAFDPSVPLKRSSELTKQEFEELILTSVDQRVQKNLKPYITSILNFSVDYQIDPFWIISIIMVESNFDSKALSPKNAMGLMQIKPDTAQFLYQLMQKDISAAQVEKNMYHPEKNIEVGVFYLKKLLYNFRLNYRLATVAYNMGPAKLRSLLVENSLDVSNYSYLVKVKERYSLVSQNYSSALKNRPHPYEMTFVVPNQGLKLEDKLISLLSSYTSENLTASFP